MISNQKPVNIVEKPDGRFVLYDEVLPLLKMIQLQEALLAKQAETVSSQTNEIERLKKSLNELGKIIQNITVGQQAAWIEWQHGKGAEEAMIWIENGLAGPGLIPDEDEPFGKEAQAWFDANNADALPACYCGRPSNILWMGEGFCCDKHYNTRKAQIGAATAPKE